MSSLLARIMLALLMLPLATVVYIVTVVGSIDLFFGSRWVDPVYLWASAVTGAFVGAYWVLLWRRTVQWTPRRRALTIATIPAAVATGGLAGGATSTLDAEFGIFIGGVVAILLWLVLTVFVWRETPAERASRVRSSSRGGIALVCPRCGYNMTGLATSNCPECGARFTVDELVALQPAREQEEMEGDSS